MKKVFPLAINFCGECPNFYTEGGKGRCAPLESINVASTDIDSYEIHQNCPLDDFKFESDGSMIINFHKEAI
jgi:hypothetical protein